MTREVHEEGLRVYRPAWVLIGKALLFFHVFMITVWSLPRPQDVLTNRTYPPFSRERLMARTQDELNNPVRSGIAVVRNVVESTHDWILLSADKVRDTPLQYYLISTGLWQFWDMFAPNPSAWDGYLTAEVFYLDGTKAEYAYPRMHDLPLFEKYLKERYRKFAERAHEEKHAFAWPFFAQRVALLNMHDVNNPPVRVQLHRHWRLILGPDEKTPDTYNDYMYFDYLVNVDKVRHDFLGS